MIFRWLPLGHLHLNGRNVDRSRVFALENGRLWMEAREGCKTNGHVYNIWQPVILFYFYCWRACFSRKKLVGKVPFIPATLGRAWRLFSNRDQGTTGMKKCLNTVSLAQHQVHFPFRMFLFLIYGGLLCYSIPYLSERSPTAAMWKRDTDGKPRNSHSTKPSLDSFNSSVGFCLHFLFRGMCR